MTQKTRYARVIANFNSDHRNIFLTDIFLFTGPTSNKKGPGNVYTQQKLSSRLMITDNPLSTVQIDI